jgi:protein-S-isoprenylcysteine O-methyltransferase Ste14
VAVEELDEGGVWLIHLHLRGTGPTSDVEVQIDNLGYVGSIRNVRDMSRWRHARAIALLPVNVTVVVPAVVLTAGKGPNVGWGLDGLMAVLPVLLGLVLSTTGLALGAWTVRLFASIGQGTLAAWDATRHLVVAGPYRYVRNPMITAVLGVLLGEAALFGSPALLIWSATFLAINCMYFVIYEEPGLERRFGEEYHLYKRNVPRWIPRRTPWAPPSTESGTFG